MLPVDAPYVRVAMRRSPWSARHAGHFTFRQSVERRPGRYCDDRRFTTTPSIRSQHVVAVSTIERRHGGEGAG